MKWNKCFIRWTTVQHWQKIGYPYVIHGYIGSWFIHNHLGNGAFCAVARQAAVISSNHRLFTALTALVERPIKDMSHFAYACKMRYPLNLVLESWEYLWFYWTFCIVILDYGLKLHKLSNHTLVMLQKWLEIH